MNNIPPADEVRFRRGEKLVFRGPMDRGRWVTLPQLRKAVRAGKANHWSVVSIDLETGESHVFCPCCEAGLDCLAWRCRGNGWTPQARRSNGVPVPALKLRPTP
jgi:hypothetical protein